VSIGHAGAVYVEITLDGTKVPDEHHISFVVERDIGQPDMASIVVSNEDHRYSKLRVSAPVEIKVGKDKTTIYKGEIVGLEPAYGRGKTRMLVRAMNKMHKMIRAKKSRTFADKTDQQILSEVVGSSGLTLNWDHEKSITYKHVYQHNQSDLEFLRTRAARMGCHIWCEDTTVNCIQASKAITQESGVELNAKDGVGEGEQLRHFTPRVSSAPIAKKISVKGWNPETKELIVGTASAGSSPLGSSNASTSSGDHGGDETFTVDQPIWSKEEADALAKAKLTDQSLNYMTGEVEAVGDPKYQLGKTIKLTINTEDASDTFNGKYYVMGITHRLNIGGKGKLGGFVTTLRVARDAEKGS